MTGVRVGGRLAVWLCALLLGAGLLVAWVALPLSAVHYDFRINFLGAAALASGLNPYDPASLRAASAALGTPTAADAYTATFERYIQPPLSATIIALVVPLGPHAAFLAYYAACLVALLASVWLGVRLGRGAPVQAAASVALLAWPAATSLALGQVDSFVALSLALSCWALTRRPGSAALAGVPLGLAAGLKLVPAAFLAYLLVTRRFRALAWAVLASLLSLAIPAVVFGPELTLAAFLRELPSLGTSGRAENLSLPGLVARLVSGPDGYFGSAAVRLPPAAATLSLALSLAALAWALHRSRRLAPPTAFLLLTAASLLAAPIAWEHYATWLLPFLVAALPAAARRPRACLLIGAALLGAPLVTLAGPGVIPLAAVGVPRGQIGLLLVAAVALGRSRESPSEVTSPLGGRHPLSRGRLATIVPVGSLGRESTFARDGSEAARIQSGSP